MSNSKVNLYIDCKNGVSGDRLCQALTELCGNKGFVEEQQQLISDALHLESEHHHHHDHGHAHDAAGDHAHDAAAAHGHVHAYAHRSYQSLLGLIDGSCLAEGVKVMAKRIYEILATAEAEVHGETLMTVHFHEVGRPQAIINMVGIAGAFGAINPGQVYCSKVMDGCGTVQCAHGEIPVPVPAVRALMDRSTLGYGQCEKPMEMVTPTGLAALLAMEPEMMETQPDPTRVVGTAHAQHGLKIVSFS